ncbi:unnamed protein product [Urochloa decumbens]|uniref:F-box domain-containing protein n=1 Tax=Urochloa decumbens TaxID=240449 RepID=A0ABC9AC30_9POAL
MPDDVLLEVLSRVGSIKDLFRFSLTSRWLLRRFTDPVFLRQLCPGQQTRFELLPRGKMEEGRMTQHTSSVSVPTFLPAPRSPLGHMDHRSLTSFVADDDGTFNYAEPLAARRGFLLMQLVPRTFHGPYLLGLCNPITGERHVLPPLAECFDDLGRYDSYAIVTAADSEQPSSSSSSGRFKFSQLLLVTTQIKSDSMSTCTSTRTADTRSWRGAPTVCLEAGSRFSMVGERSAVIHHGAAHCLCNDRPYPTRDDCMPAVQTQRGGGHGHGACLLGKDDAHPWWRLAAPLRQRRRQALGRLCVPLARGCLDAAARRRRWRR